MTRERDRQCQWWSEKSNGRTRRTSAGHLQTRTTAKSCDMTKSPNIRHARNDIEDHRDLKQQPCVPHSVRFAFDKTYSNRCSDRYDKESFCTWDVDSTNGVHRSHERIGTCLHTCTSLSLDRIGRVRFCSVERCSSLIHSCWSTVEHSNGEQVHRPLSNRRDWWTEREHWHSRSRISVCPCSWLRALDLPRGNVCRSPSLKASRGNKRRKVDTCERISRHRRRDEKMTNMHVDDVASRSLYMSPCVCFPLAERIGLVHIFLLSLVSWMNQWKALVRYPSFFKWRKHAISLLARYQKHRC